MYAEMSGENEVLHQINLFVVNFLRFIFISPSCLYVIIIIFFNMKYTLFDGVISTPVSVFNVKY